MIVNGEAFGLNTERAWGTRSTGVVGVDLNCVVVRVIRVLVMWKENGE